MTENPTGATGAENNDRSNDAEQPQTSHNPNATPTEDFGAAALSSNDSRDGYRPADQGYASPQPQAPQSQQSPQQPLSPRQPQSAQQGQDAYGPIPQRPASFPNAAGYGANAAYGAPQNGQPNQPNQPTTPYPAYGAPRQGASNPFAQTAAYPATGAVGQHQQAGQHGAHAHQGAPAGGGSHNGGGHGNGTGGAFGPAAQHQPSSPAPKRRPTAALLVATLAIGALIGGAAGAGSYALIDGSGTPVANSSNGSQSVTINDTTSVTRTSAVAAKASPSVVTIAVQGDDGAGTGSGVILSKDGYVLTNNHVITLDGQNATPTIQVTANDGKIYSAKIVGTDPVYDLAVIKLDNASGLEPMEFGDPNKLNVGDVAIAIGAPLGLAGTVTDGIVSALNRSITVASSAVPDKSGSDSDSNTDKPSNPFGFQLPGQEQSQTQTQTQSSISLAVIQTDASINPGNSGGALLDSDGKLIGINVAIASAGSGSSDSQSGSIGVGFAIPSDTAERIANEIIKDGKATHGLLGASVRDAAQVSGSTVAGALLGDISSGGAAEKGGLKTGDIVTNFNGHPVTDANDLTAQVRALAANSKAEVTYVRDGKSFTVDVTLGELVL